MCRLEEKDYEILAAALRVRGKFYSLYKETSIPLATAWRRVQRLLQMGYLTQVDGVIDVGVKGLVALAARGDVHASVELAKRYNTTREAVEYFVKELCQYVEDISFMPAAELSDFLRFFSIADLYRFKDTPAEELVAKLLLDYCQVCVIETECGKYIFGQGYILASYCKICGEKYELFVKCPLYDKFFSSVKKVFIKSGNGRGNEDN
ncbi:MAG: hypothetical protein ACP5H5_03450 [Pyrobaculum sp.]|jgi:hypothetical protein